MSLETSNKMKALVLGHSFIKRLRRWMRINGRSMSTRKHDVHLYGVGGRTIAKTYYNDLKVVRRKRPDVVFLQVGGNDILKESSPTLILVRMKRLVSVLLEKYHVSTVIVGSVFCRRKPRGLSRRAYDRKKQKTNKFLSKEFGTSKRGKKSFFFPHKFFKEKYFDRDGIHLNQDGNRCFYNSIKKALRFSLSN
jgi:lysophospholipase L1-like esterase